MKSVSATGSKTTSRTKAPANAETENETVSTTTTQMPIVTGKSKKAPKKAVTSSPVICTNTPIPNFVPPQNTLMYFTLSSTSALRAIFDALKELPPSISLTVTEGGLKMINDLDPKCILVVDIPVEDLGAFYIKEQLSLGLRTARFSQVIRTIHAKDPVVMYVLAEDPTNLYINIINTSTEFSRTIILPLLAMQAGAMSLTLPEFVSKCKIPTIRIQKMLKDTMSLGGDKVTIIKTPGHLRMDSMIADYRQEIKYVVEDSVCNTQAVIEGRYNVSPIKAFIKSIALSQHINVMMSPSLPLVFEYNFAQKSSFSIIITDVRDIRTLDKLK